MTEIQLELSGMQISINDGGVIVNGNLVYMNSNKPESLEIDEEAAEKRMDIIGQNGPTGEHYEDVDCKVSLSKNKELIVKTGKVSVFDSFGHFIGYTSLDKIEDVEERKLMFSSNRVQKSIYDKLGNFIGFKIRKNRQCQETITKKLDGE